MTTGVKVVGAPAAADERDDVRTEPNGSQPDEPEASPAVPGRPGAGPAPEVRSLRRRLAVVAVVAVLGLIGTVGFGVAWASSSSSSGSQAQVTASARAFLVALTNFTAKTVDADFGRLQAMATGPFATQAQKFFNSSIRQQLETALAQSNGQIRDLYVQSIKGNQATVYAVVDQLYVNNKVSAPQSDVLRLVVNLTDTSSGWKIADVSVLEGPAPGTSSTP